jgi:hypothetical protein
MYGCEVSDSARGSVSGGGTSPRIVSGCWTAVVRKGMAQSVVSGEHGPWSVKNALVSTCRQPLYCRCNVCTLAAISSATDAVITAALSPNLSIQGSA